MTAVDDIIAQIPLNRLAAQLGVDEGTAEQAARQALPALLGGMGANAQDPRGAASLAGAVRQHDPQLVEGGVDLNEVDVVDGDKIVSNVFGGQREAVVNRLAGPGQGGVGGGLVAKLLPLLAPIVMSYLAKQLSGAGGGSAKAPQGSAAAPDIGDLLGGLLGGGAARPGGGSSGGGSITDLLGGLLGGGRR
ncbi:MAG TPA: DUF937 domain-containing protein [Jiangellales bacterium]|nr:DUF937 domain-containing protein [Jiangellales bacterium]